MSGDIPLNINIKEPRWDQSTFVGRATHFFTVTDPRNILLPNEQLERAKKIVHDYRYGLGFLPQFYSNISRWLPLFEEYCNKIREIICLGKISPFVS